jgi:cell division septation protein DedD/DNA-directed RNA polymerase specialized sigma24 family protein
MPGGLMSQPVQESDQTLAARAAQGDEAAFVALYDRLFEPVYDFLLRLLLSRRKAATAALSTFLRFRRRLSEGRWRGRPRLAALAVAYQAAMEAGGEQTAGTSAGGEEGEEPAAFARVNPGELPGPGEMAWAQEEAPIIWEAAACLDRAEYALLDLHLRQGLDATQIGPVVGVSRIEAWRVISRLKKAAGEAFTSLIMLRLGRQRCQELGQLAVSMEKAILPPESRRAVSDHVVVCPTCLETRTRLVPPLNVLAAFLPVAPAPGVKEDILQDLLAYTAAQAGAGMAAAAPAGAPQWPRAMSPPPQHPHGPVAGGGPTGGPAFAILVGAAAVLALPVAALALWLVVLSGDGGGGSAGAGPTSTPLAGAALAPCGSGGPETPGLVTCTPTPTSTPTATSTAAAATKTPGPTDTATPSPTASPTEVPIATPTSTPVEEETPTGIVETATPKPSPKPHTTPTAVTSPSPAGSPSPSPSP